MDKVNIIKYSNRKYYITAYDNKPGRYVSMGTLLDTYSALGFLKVVEHKSNRDITLKTFLSALNCDSVSKENKINIIGLLNYIQENVKNIDETDDMYNLIIK